MVNKAPAFQFYAENFLVGTAEMSSEEVGGYIRLLCHQWHKGKLPDNDRVLSKLSGCRRSALIIVRKKFVCQDGFLINVRLEHERKKQEIWRLKSSLAGKKSGVVRAKNLEESEPNFNNLTQIGSNQIATNSEPGNDIPSSIGSNQNETLQSSSSSSINNIYLYPGEQSKFFIGEEEYHGLPSKLLLTEQKDWFEQKMTGISFAPEKVFKAFDQKFKADSFTNMQHYRNSVKSILLDLIKQENGDHKTKNSKISGATKAIESGRVKKFGSTKL